MEDSLTCLMQGPNDVGRDHVSVSYDMWNEPIGIGPSLTHWKMGFMVMLSLRICALRPRFRASCLDEVIISKLKRGLRKVGVNFFGIIPKIIPNI